MKSLKPYHKLLLRPNSISELQLLQLDGLGLLEHISILLAMVFKLFRWAPTEFHGDHDLQVLNPIPPASSS